MSMTKRDKLIPWYFVLFFVVIAIVDGIMVTIAVRTQTGVVTEHSYEKGLAYNKIIEASNKQDELGWQGEINYADNNLLFVLKDKEGKNITPEKATAKITRPTQAGMDFELELTGERTEIKFPKNGLWKVQIDAVYNGQTYQQSKRIVAE